SLHAVVLLWLLAVGLGFALLLQYSMTPGQLAEPAGSWPAGTGLAPLGVRPRLVMVLHPHCSCSRASLVELEKLRERLGERVQITLVFVQPEGMPEAWTRSELWRSAEAFAEVETRVDPGGAVADAFGVRTSGHVLLYGPGGEL